MPPPAAEMIGGADALAAEDDAAGREVRAWNNVDQLVDRERRVVDQRHAGVDHLAEIVRRDVGRHADGDAAGAVDQQVREPGRQDRRLLLGIVVVRLEIDGFHVDVGQHGERRLGQPRFGISVGRRRIAVDRAEIALAVDQRHAQREVLRHADHRVVNRLVAMRMVFTDHVTFPIAAKAVVKGPNAHPFYRWAAEARPKDVPRWNFHKYLIGRDGYIADAFPESVTPDDTRIKTGIARALAAA